MQTVTPFARQASMAMWSVPVKATASIFKFSQPLITSAFKGRLETAMMSASFPLAINSAVSVVLVSKYWISRESGSASAAMESSFSSSTPRGSMITNFICTVSFFSDFICSSIPFFLRPRKTGTRNGLPAGSFCKILEKSLKSFVFFTYFRGKTP